MPAEKEAFNLPNETPLPFRCDEVLSADSHSEGIIVAKTRYQYICSD